MEHGATPPETAMGDDGSIRTTCRGGGASWDVAGISTAVLGDEVVEAEVPPPNVAPDCDGLSDTESEDVEGGESSGDHRDLRVEASSLRHLLMHGWKNPYCDDCEHTAVR